MWREPKRRKREREKGAKSEKKDGKIDEKEKEREEVSTQVEEKYQSSRISFISIPRSIVVEILARFHSFLPLCRFLFFFPYVSS